MNIRDEPVRQMSSACDEAVDSLKPSPEFLSVIGKQRPAFLLGLDVGTSGVRAALFDELGNEIDGSEARSLRHATPMSSFGELDADQIVDLVIETIDQLFAATALPDGQIAHISLSCFWHSLIGVDSAFKPTTHLLTWADTRASSVVQQLKSQFDQTEIHQRTGCRFHPSYWPAKLLWLKHEQPEIFNRTTRWLGFSEYLELKLFAEYAASVSMASATGLFDQRRCDWDWDFIARLGISSDSLPVMRSGVGPKLKDIFKDRWKALGEARLVTTLGDGAANNIGGGCCTRDRIALMIGTSGAMRAVYRGEPADTLPAGLWSYRADCQRVTFGGALSDGGGLYRWLSESLALVGGPEAIEKELTSLEPDAHGLTVLPFWSGERSTGWSTNARGAILGLTQETKPIEIVRAAMEAIAYRFALIARGLETLAPGATIVATGNALRSSAVWRQILADVLGRPLSFGGAAEASLRGAALLALEAVGTIQNIEELPLAIDHVVEPDVSRHVVYRAAIDRQEHFYHRLFE